MRNRRGLVKVARVAMLIASLVALIAAAPASAQTVQQGDVFASVNNGNVNWYRSNGTFVKTINTGQGGYTTGGNFDSSGNFYVTNFSASSVTKFDNIGNVVNTYPTGGTSPESILFNAAGEIYVGHAFNSPRKYDSSFTFIESYPVTGGSDWIDIEADQCTMLHTFEGASIERYDVCTKTQLAPFASGLGGSAFALRIRPNGEVMVANGVNILRLDSGGGILQTYQPGGELSGWFALNLDPDGTSFWTGTFDTGNFYKVDIATGSVLLGPIATCGGICLYGLTVAGELSVVQPTPTPGGQPTPTPTATVLPATPTPPTPVPVTGRGGLAILIGLLALSGALILWRWTARG